MCLNNKTRNFTKNKVWLSKEKDKVDEFIIVIRFPVGPVPRLGSHLSVDTVFNLYIIFFVDTSVD